MAAVVGPPPPGALAPALLAYRNTLEADFNTGIGHIAANPAPADLPECRATIGHMVNILNFLNADRRHSARVLNDQDATIVRLNADLANANAAVAALVAAPARLNRIKVPQPKGFSGVQSEARPFLQSLLLYFQQHPADFPDDITKIRFALALLEGKALMWASKIQEAVLNPPVVPYLPAQDWDEFERFFRQTYFDPDEQRSARSKMTHLKQERSVAEYTADWNHQAQLLGWEDTNAARASYFQGLKPRVQQEIIMRGEPDTLQGLIDLATRIDAAQFAAFKASPSSTKTGASGKPNAAGSKLLQMPGVNQALPAGTKVKTEPVNFAKGHVNPTERARRLAGNLCLYCGQAGHMRFNCPNHPATANNVEEETVQNPYGVAYAENF
jgi:Retrotransposon gag protein